MLQQLADILEGGSVDLLASEEQLRQLGYAAQVARGRVPDPENRLLRTIRSCRTALSSNPCPEAKADRARDALQREWGAAWHVDAAKLATELPLYIAARGA